MYSSLVGVIWLVVVPLLWGTTSAQPDFSQVLTVFEERCTLCHSGANPPLGLRLADYSAVMEGSERGPVVLPGNPEESELIKRIEGRSLPRMPLTGPPFLDELQITLIRDWIASGAPGPEARAADTPAEATTAEAEDRESGEGITDVDAEAAEPDDGGVATSEGVTFEAVETILLTRCVECHTENGVLGAPPEGLRLDSYDRVIRGGERVVVVPGSPLASELYRRVLGHSLPRMPFDGPPFLSEEEMEMLQAWIEAGARSASGERAPLAIGEEVRLGGRLTGLWELDGLPLDVSANTRIDDDPGVGDYVEVRGVITPEGGIRVERLRTRE